MTPDDTDYFHGMTEEQIKEYKESEKQIETERIEQYHNDIQIIRNLKKKLPKKLFRSIVTEIHESENWSNLRIVDEPTGRHQGEHRCFGKVWVDQYCEYEDCYSGYVYVELPDGKFLAWDYWM